VAVEVQRWGVFDPDHHEVHLHPEPRSGDEDLLDFAAVHVFLRGGEVYAVTSEEMPDEPPLAAIFHY